MYSRIALMVPTYGRSNTILPRLIKSVIKTTEDRTSVIWVFVVNTSDKASERCIKELLNGWEYEILTESLNSPSLSKYYNMMYSHTGIIDGRTIATMIGDDMEFKTHGWDQKVIRHINSQNGIGVFYAAGDERFNDGLCVNLFVTDKMCVGQKYMCDKFHANGIDMVWQLAADAADLDCYMEDVIILHHQCSRKHIGPDGTYNRLRPQRLKAIRDRGYESHYAKEKIRKWAKEGLCDASVVKDVKPSQLQHRRVGRRYFNGNGFKRCGMSPEEAVVD